MFCYGDFDYASTLPLFQAMQYGIFHHGLKKQGKNIYFFRIHILPYFRYAVKFIREPELLDIQINIDMLQLSA